VSKGKCSSDSKRKSKNLRNTNFRCLVTVLQLPLHNWDTLKSNPGRATCKPDEDILWFSLDPPDKWRHIRVLSLGMWRRVSYRRSTETYCLHLQGRGVSLERSHLVLFLLILRPKKWRHNVPPKRHCTSTWRYIPGESTVHSNRYENFINQRA
jgi:hypothetical protein